MTREEFILEGGNVCRSTHTDPNGGCLLIECEDCGYKVYWYEGNLGHFYDKNKMFTVGCYGCGKKNYKLKIGYCEI